MVKEDVSTVKEELLRSKLLYKVLLIILKVIPTIIALSYLLNTIISYFGYSANILSHLFGVSLITWLFLFISSIVYRYCIYHRMFLYYILITDSLNITDYYIGIPVNDFNLLSIHIIISGIFLFLILYFYVKVNKISITKYH